MSPAEHSYVYESDSDSGLVYTELITEYVAPKPFGQDSDQDYDQDSVQDPLEHLVALEKSLVEWIDHLVKISQHSVPRDFPGASDMPYARVRYTHTDAGLLFAVPGDLVPGGVKNGSQSQVFVVPFDSTYQGLPKTMQEMFRSIF
jgi:hypothetical protein